MRDWKRDTQPIELFSLGSNPHERTALDDQFNLFVDHDDDDANHLGPTPPGSKEYPVRHGKWQAHPLLDVLCGYHHQGRWSTILLSRPVLRFEEIQARVAERVLEWQ